MIIAILIPVTTGFVACAVCRFIAPFRLVLYVQCIYCIMLLFYGDNSYAILILYSTACYIGFKSTVFGMYRRSAAMSALDSGRGAVIMETEAETVFVRRRCH